MATESEILNAQMEREHGVWKRATRFYAALSIVLRLIIILGSAIGASQEAFRSALSAHYSLLMPIIALSVAFAAALDSWLKPRDKWKGFMRDSTELDALFVEWAAAKVKGDSSGIHAEFKRLRERHLNDNVY